MLYNIDFSISALVINLILIFCFYYRKNIPNIQNKVFLCLLWTSLIITVFDILGSVTPSYPDKFSLWINNTVTYMYFITINFLTVIYTFYIITITDTQGRLFKTWRGLLFIVPAVIIALVIILNSSLRWIFYFDENSIYHRGIGVYFLYAIAAYYLIFGIVYAIIYKDIISTPKRLALYSFAVLSAIPVFIQVFIPNLLLSTFGISICMFLVFVTIQKPEEVLDSHTKLFNRNALLTMLAINFRNKKSFTAISVSIDDFEYFKRTFGVTMMNIILKSLADRLTSLSSKNKQLYYLDNGQFVIVISERKKLDEFTARIKQLFESKVGNKQMEINLDTSICIVLCPQDADTIDGLMDFVEMKDRPLKLDQSIYYASQLVKSHRNRILEVERAVENAFNNDSFQVYYQPIYSTVSNKINSAEALVRLHDANLGNITPGEFIPITEKNGSIIRLGAIVFRKVCEFIASNDLKALGLEYIEVNLSVAQCMQKKLAEQLLETLQEFNIPTEYINLEITETAAAYSPEALTINMNELSASGVKFSLDDYGTGFSNITRMINLPFDLVKLDMEIISDMGNERTYIALENTVSMLHQLKIGIVAEGVETLEQMQSLTKMGCDYLQGYYFSKPVPAEQFLQFITEFVGETKIDNNI